MVRQDGLSVDPAVSRSPCGERGLKSESWSDTYFLGWSLPVRGAWIEIRTIACVSAGAGASLPVRGAWIEIPRSTYTIYW